MTHIKTLIMSAAAIVAITSFSYAQTEILSPENAEKYQNSARENNYTGIIEDRPPLEIDRSDINIGQNPGPNETVFDLDNDDREPRIKYLNSEEDESIPEDSNVRVIE